MRKQSTYIFSLIICLVFIQARISENNDFSGIKLALDYNNLNLLKILNYTSLFHNKTFLPNALNLGNGGILGYKVNLGNFTVDTIVPPQTSDVQPRDIETNSPSMRILLKNFYIKLLCDYAISVSAYNDNGVQSPIQLNATQFSLDLTFNKTSNYIKVNAIQFDISSLEISFNGSILKAFYWLLKYEIISLIKSNVQSLSSTIENVLNEATNSPILFNIDGLKVVGLNLTITDKPNLIFSQLSSPKAQINSIPSIVKFLSEASITQNTTSNINVNYRCNYFPNYWYQWSSLSIFLS
jgi:hypothetical protein